VCVCVCVCVCVVLHGVSLSRTKGDSKMHSLQFEVSGG
jgi:hypothetical protein